MGVSFLLSISAGIFWNILWVSENELCSLLLIIGFSSSGFSIASISLKCSCCCCLAVGSFCNWKIFGSNWGTSGKEEALKTDGGGSKGVAGVDRDIVDNGGGNPPLLSSTLSSGKFLLNGFKLCSFWFNLIYFEFAPFSKTLRRNCQSVHRFQFHSGIYKLLDSLHQI